MGKLSSGQYSAPVDEVLTLIVANTLSVNKANYSSTVTDGPPSLTREGLRMMCRARECIKARYTRDELRKRMN